MKKICLIVLLLSCLYSNAEVKPLANHTLTKKERKVSAVAVKRAVNFYNWYINYLIKNNSKPIQHLVIEQYTSAHMQSIAANNTNNFDVFLASDQFDPNNSLIITPEKVEANRINLKVQVIGVNPYIFHVDMVIQKGNWCIDLAVADEDLNPAIEEAK